MEESTARTIHALIYSAVVFGIGISVYRDGRQGRGLAWQALGLATILIFTIFALFALPWVDAFISGALLVLEGVLIFRFWRVRQCPSPKNGESEQLREGGSSVSGRVTRRDPNIDPTGPSSQISDEIKKKCN